MDLKSRLVGGAYHGMEDRIKLVTDYGVIAGGEIEDLIPSNILAGIVTRYLPRPAGSDQEFNEIIDASFPIVPQIDSYASGHDIDLADGWKVEIATLFKQRLDRLSIESATEEMWASVFEDFIAS